MGSVDVRGLMMMLGDYECEVAVARSEARAEAEAVDAGEDLAGGARVNQEMLLAAGVSPEGARPRRWTRPAAAAAAAARSACGVWRARRRRGRRPRRPAAGRPAA